MWSNRFYLPLTFFLALLTLPPTLSAQTIQGTIVDSELGTPVNAVEVVLRDAVGEFAARAKTETDSLGKFRVEAPLPGRYQLVLSRIGYATQTTNEFEVSGGEVLALEIRMSSESIQLDSLVVVEQRRSVNSAIARFHERAEWTQKTGRGRVYMGEELQNLGNVRTLYMFNHGSSRGCPMTVLVDNLPIADPNELDYLGSAERLEGVEVYRSPHQIPEEFSHINACSLMLVWTRPGGGSPFTWKRFLAGGVVAAALFFLGR